VNEFEVTYINKPDRMSAHEHITHIGNTANNWRMTREEAIRRIDSNQDAFSSPKLPSCIVLTAVTFSLFAAQGQHGVRARCTPSRQPRSCQRQQQHCRGGK
jgi:hypothetical protein